MTTTRSEARLPFPVHSTRCSPRIVIPDRRRQQRVGNVLVAYRPREPLHRQGTNARRPAAIGRRGVGTAVDHPACTRDLGRSPTLDETPDVQWVSAIAATRPPRGALAAPAAGLEHGIGNQDESPGPARG